LEVMAGISSPTGGFEPESPAKYDKQLEPLIEAIRNTHRRFWKSLSD